MKKVLDYIQSYFKETFSWKVYGYVALFLILTISVNFAINVDGFIESNYFGGVTGIFLFFLMYSFTYYGVAVPILFFVGKKNMLRSGEFWWKSALLIAIMAIRRANYAHLEWGEAMFWDFTGDMSDVDYGNYRYMCNIFLQLNKTIFTFLPLILLKWWWDKEKVTGLYGFHFKKFDIKPYIWFLVIMAPLIYWASYQGDFLHSYPRYKPWENPDAFALGESGRAIGFELAYGLNFVSLELLFRGAMILGMVHLIGRECVLPMVTLYAAIHFGKPLGECLGSIFGGYVLGILSLNTKSIWGGTIAHIGVAWGMEAAAWVGHQR